MNDFNNQYDSHQGDHLLTGDKVERGSAQKVMSDAGGLFNVSL